jgi:hypothetical protein
MSTRPRNTVPALTPWPQRPGRAHQPTPNLTPDHLPLTMDDGPLTMDHAQLPKQPVAAPDPSAPAPDTVFPDNHISSTRERRSRRSPSAADRSTSVPRAPAVNKQDPTPIHKQAAAPTTPSAPAPETVFPDNHISATRERRSRRSPGDADRNTSTLPAPAVNKQLPPAPASAPDSPLNPKNATLSALGPFTPEP